MPRARAAAKKAGAGKAGPSKAAPAKAAPSTAKPRPIPEDFHTITPYIVVSSGEAALEHYAKALGASFLHKILVPGTNKVMHACLEIGSSKLFLCGENEKMKAPKGGSGGSQFYLYVADVEPATSRPRPPA
jgi:PhnB protein